MLESLKDRWFQADNNPTDQLLNEQEFLSFLHPEHSKGMLKYMVKEIVRDLGKINIRIGVFNLPEEAFANLPANSSLLTHPLDLEQHQH